MNERFYRPILLTVLILGAAFLGIQIIAKGFELGPTIGLKTKGQPTIGYPKAQVHVVVFEEPKCSDCKIYSNEIFPKIKEKYIETNKILYTLIPVSFLPDSMNAANFLECIYHQDPKYPNSDLFFKVLDAIYAKQPDEHTNWTTDKYLLQIASRFPEIDRKKLSRCMAQKSYFHLIEENTDYARSIMHGTVTTPSVYVDGAKVYEISWPAVSEKIDLALKLKGAQ